MSGHWPFPCSTKGRSAGEVLNLGAGTAFDLIFRSLCNNRTLVRCGSRQFHTSLFFIAMVSPPQIIADAEGRFYVVNSRQSAHQWFV